MLQLGIPSIQDLKAATINTFNISPCKFQLEAVQLQFSAYQTSGRECQGVLCSAGTSAGKTLAFLMPLLVAKNAITIIISPLNVLNLSWAQ